MIEEIIKTDLLVVGAGPAGASLACFLSSHGLTGIIIAAAPGTANTPRAHINNAAGLECLRDVGLEEDCVNLGTGGDSMEHMRWCHSMAGEEFARIYSWGSDPARKGEYDAASPCRHTDLPQTELEPILTKRAVHTGWSLRFNTRLLTFTRPQRDVIICEVQDDLSNKKYKIQTRFLFGCDGARSQVVRELAIPLIKKPGQGLALNVLVKADMAHLIPNRTGNLHWVFVPEKDYPPWCWASIVRMVKPWKEWMFICMPVPGADVSVDQFSPSKEEVVPRIKEIIGDASVDVEVYSRYANFAYSFCFGDATHRHPPFNGLGSNTCIQDAFNLAWKIAYVMSGKADTKLLDSFSTERQPVGKDVITRANQGLRDHMGWIQAIGMMHPNKEARMKVLAEFDEPTAQGRKRRQAFQEGIEATSTEVHGIGIEMNQQYLSNAVYLDDEGSAPPLPKNPGKKISTIDLAGHGRFCLLTGPGGQDWKIAAEKVSKSLGIEIKAYSIGWKQDYEDVYFDWAKRREVEEDGCVLVRPDRFVAWRSTELVGDADAKLEKVIRKVLSL